MKRGAALLILLTACATSQPQYRRVDLMPLYWSFWDKAKGQDVATQIRLAREMVTRKRPDIYNETVLGADPESAWFAEWYPKYLAWVSPHFDAMERLSRTVAHDLDRIDRRFRREFPDFRYDGDVYFMNSFGAFDGATRTVNGKTALLFGLETLAAVHGDSAAIEPQFDHELFHLYHRQFFKDEDENDPVWAGLWREGLATYVARRMNPSASARQIHGLPDTTPEKVRANLSHVVDYVLSRLDSTQRADYASLFLGDKPPEADPPARAGYYVGYLVAERLGRTRSLQQLAKMPPGEVRKAIETTLRALRD